jgi:hypothetical protein
MSISAMKQDPDDDIYDIWVEQKPVRTSDISQEPVDETAKCKHEWVGLTDQEIYDIREDHTYNDEEFNEWGFAKDIEAKLKEKNVPQR